MEQQRYVGEILVRRGAIEAAKMEELLLTAVEKELELLDVILASRETEQGKVVRALAAEMGIDFREEIKPEEISPELIELVPITFARTHMLLPLSDDGAWVTVAVANPLDPSPLDDLRALLGKPIEPVAATAEQIEDAINAVYERKADANIGQDHVEEDDDIQDLLDMKDEAPVIRWVNNLFYNASRSNASDIHIEPGDKEVIVRNRIDGRLFLVKSAPKSALPSIVSRVKIEAGLNIAEKRLPQDGRITKKIQGRMIDVRVSTIPTAGGERIVMRLLDKERVVLDLTSLGFEGGRLHTLHHLASRPNGIILVTGPTGSGKTTTLSACLAHINSPDLNILTAEDPVEYDIPGVGQLQIHPKIGLTFASALRAFLRQDPDVIMVGEIRDHETAEIAIHASLTGHLVLSTLHTNDAASAVTRLVEMEVQPFLISSSVLGVIAQRLVRKLCRHCRQAYKPSAQDIRSLGLDDSRLHALRGSGVQPFRGMKQHEEEAPLIPEIDEELSGEDLAAIDGDAMESEPTRVAFAPDEGASPFGMAAAPLQAMSQQSITQQVAAHQAVSQHLAHPGGAPAVAQHGMIPVGGLPAGSEPAGLARGTLPPDLSAGIFYRAVGCSECAQTGYRGRLAISEMMIIDEPVRREILNNSDSATITRVATSRGMRTLREDGARLVLLGTTSLEEVLAATQAGEVDP